MAYLADVLERVVSGRTKRNELHTLLPWNWAANTSAAITARRLSRRISSGANRQLKYSPVLAVSLTLDRRQPRYLQRRLDTKAFADGELLGQQRLDGARLAALELLDNMTERLQCPRRAQ